MFVILWIEEKKYYTYDPKCHWNEDISFAATFKTLDSATRYAKNGLKDKIQMLEYIEVKEKTEEDKALTPIPDMTKEEAETAYEELYKAVENFGKVAENIPAIMKYYQNIQSEQDKLQEDLLHKFEFIASNNILFVKLGRMLKACREKRREAKDRIEYIIAISNTKPKDILKTHVKYNSLIANRIYSPRIAPELFD